MKIIKLQLTIFLLLTLIISCDKAEENPDSIVETYPMRVGTEWNYDRQLIINEYEFIKPDVILNSDTVDYKVKVWIDKDTLMGDTLNVKIFKALESDLIQASINYMYLDNEGLKTYVYSNPGSMVFAYNFHQRIIQLRKSRLKSTHNYYTNDNQIYLENEPTLNLKLPLQLNLSWTYIKPTQQKSLQIDKKVVGIEKLKLIDTIFTCYKIDYEYRNDERFEGIEISDWVSKQGLIKRKMSGFKIPTSTKETETIDGYVEYTEILTLSNLKL